MTFKFKIESATHIRSADAYLLDGRLEDGKILSESEAHIVELNLPIKIKSVAIVSGVSASKDRLTLNIERPSVEMSRIGKGMMLEG
jgi:hypothetical protein